MVRINFTLLFIILLALPSIYSGFGATSTEIGGTGFIESGGSLQRTFTADEGDTISVETSSDAALNVYLLIRQEVRYSERGSDVSMNFLNEETSAWTFELENNWSSSVSYTYTIQVIDPPLESATRVLLFLTVIPGIILAGVCYYIRRPTSHNF